jgi:muramoyltetrapeptide carboxypeptidase
VNNTWKPLEAGEPIGIVALSGPVDEAKLEAGLEVLRSWGNPIVEASNLRREELYLAGRDDERVAGVEEVLDAGTRWILAARGGYGAARILEAMPWERLRSREARFIGFSDLTAILNPLASDGGAVQIHGPMVAAGLTGRHNGDRLHALLRGELVGEILFRFPQSSIVRAGRAEGRAIGGNLTLLTSLLGTPWEPDFDGGILFLEEVEEPLYRLDRMLTHLRSSGKLQKVKALIGGSLRGCRPASARSEIWRSLLIETAPPGVPIVIGLPFGHGATNMAFPIGGPVTLDTRAQGVRWS